jgi:hypothetical protein
LPPSRLLTPDVEGATAFEHDVDLVVFVWLLVVSELVPSWSGHRSLARRGRSSESFTRARGGRGRGPDPGSGGLLDL